MTQRERGKILFTVHSIKRLRVEPGFPCDDVPALHVCDDGVLFKDAFIAFDNVVSVEAPEELSLTDSDLAGQQGEISLQPGVGALVLRQACGEPREAVFFLPDAEGFSDKIRKAWTLHRKNLPAGWRRLRDESFSLSIPADWEMEDAKHPHLRVRLFSRADGVLLNVLAYQRDNETRLPEVVTTLLDRLRKERKDLHLRTRTPVVVGGLEGERLVVEERSTVPPVVSDTFLVLASSMLFEVQFLLPAEAYERCRPVLEKVAYGMRWR
jgi:hypothetical protein